MDSIFVALSTFGEFDTSVIDSLSSAGFPVTIHPSGKRITKYEILVNATNATVIIAGVETYDKEVLDNLPKLKCIVRCGAGVDAVDLLTAKEKQITVLNTPDIPSLAVAEMALSLFLSLSRNLRPQANRMGERKWERVEAHLLSGKTIGIIGFGRIGRKIAEFLKPFDVNILVCDPYINNESLLDNTVLLVDKDTLISQADIISIHASKVESTEVIIAYDDFSKMKKGAILVNLSRGGMIDEQGLIDALESGHLSGAGLDVFSKEPYIGPLCDLENVILTPHSATLTVETRIAMEQECVDKALRFLSNQLILNEKVI